MAGPNFTKNYESVKPKTKRIRKRVSVKWCDELIFKLISAVESRECLWNASRTDYKIKQKREAAWQEIAADVFNNKYNAVQVNAKWSNLRIQFKSYYSKKRRTNCGENKVYWLFYKAMMFIARDEELQTESNMVSDQETLNGSIGSKRDESSRPKASFSGATIRNKPKKLVTSVAVEHKNIASECMEQEINKIGQADTFQTFGNFLASELRNVSNPSRANKIQQKLQRMLHDCIDNLEPNSCTVNRKTNSSTPPSPPPKVLKPNKKMKYKETRKHRRMALIELACSQLLEEPDEFEILGKTWANEMRKISPPQQIHAKKAINDVLYEAQLVGSLLDENNGAEMRNTDENESSESTGRSRFSDFRQM